MPNKQKHRTSTSEEDLLEKLSKDNNIILPLSLRQKYVVGRMIGNGYFAVVRLCKDITTNEEHALKIIDKSKCKGKVSQLSQLSGTCKYLTFSMCYLVFWLCVRKYVVTEIALRFC